MHIKIFDPKTWIIYSIITMTIFIKIIMKNKYKKAWFFFKWNITEREREMLIIPIIFVFQIILK